VANSSRIPSSATPCPLVRITDSVRRALRKGVAVDDDSARGQVGSFIDDSDKWELTGKWSGHATVLRSLQILQGPK